MSVGMMCGLCGSSSYAIVRDSVRHDIKRKVLRCGQCNFVYLEPLEQVGPDYYSGQDYRQRHGPTINQTANCQEIFNTYYPFQKDIIGEIETILRPDMKVLDVGCSTGHFLAALKGKVGERVGMEFNRDEVDFIRHNLDFKVYSEPIEQLVMPEGPFDLITALQVLEHVDHPLTFIKNLMKHLKPGGHLYLELPNINDPLLEYYQVPGYDDFYFREPHLSYFSVRTLRRLLDQAGLAGPIKTVQRYNFLNHLHWKFTNQPQGNFVIGNSDPVLVATTGGDAAVKQDLNDFIKRTDEEYKKIIIKHGLGESLTFLGKKVS